MAEGAVVGIDLGTTNSVAAIVENGRPRIISDTGGGYLIPSVVAIDEKGNRLVGQAAKRQTLINPIHTVYGAKRLVGRDIRSNIVDEIQEHFKYRITTGEGSDVLIQLREDSYGLEEISAMILDHVRNVAQDMLGQEISRAVVTVPAYFNDRQRQAVRDAGNIAQLEVLRIINEPTAAAMAYGFGKGLKQKLAIFDFGGGTFDVSILELRDNVFEVKATGGDTFLGGVDFDNRIVEWIIHCFEKEHGIDLSKDPMSHQRLLDASERVKIDLSTMKEARVNIPYITTGPEGPINLDLKIKREEFEQLTRDIIDKTLESCNRVLYDCKLQPPDIDAVLLVGGTTRIPMVASRVEDFFGKAPSKAIHPDEAVALGAALLADALVGGSEEQVVLLDVLPITIGLQGAGGKAIPVFERNTSIPNQKQKVFTTSKDNQTTLKLKILQGDHAEADKNEIIGEFTFSGIRPAVKGQARVEVLFNISQEGILSLSAKDPDTGAAQQSQLQVESSLHKTRHPELIKPRKPVEKKEAEKVIRTEVKKEVKLKAGTAPAAPPEKAEEKVAQAAGSNSTPPPKPVIQHESGFKRFIRNLKRSLGIK
jgi:molecular chaperone DnaK